MLVFSELSSSVKADQFSVFLKAVNPLSNWAADKEGLEMLMYPHIPNNLVLNWNLIGVLLYLSVSVMFQMHY